MNNAKTHLMGVFLHETKQGSKYPMNQKRNMAEYETLMKIYFNDKEFALRTDIDNQYLLSLSF